MLTLSETQWSTWLALYGLPLFRVLALLTAAPVFSNRAVPTRVRLALGLAVTLVLAPTLAPLLKPLPLGSWLILPAIVSEILIGVAIGFFLRLIFAAIDLAAAFVGFQMGLSFAVFFSPTSGAQTPVLNEFIGVFATLLFLALDGHLMLILALARSFEWLPPLGVPWAWEAGWAVAVQVPAILFTTAFMIALPVTAALLLTNIALGFLTRTAPQLNIFAIGFPITITIGFLALWAVFPALGEAMQQLFVDGLSWAERFLHALGALPT